MGLVYIGFGLIWLLLLACNWKDLLRVQFWVGGVIFLGEERRSFSFKGYPEKSLDCVSLPHSVGIVCNRVFNL